jgi:hypothetical protein
MVFPADMQPVASSSRIHAEPEDSEPKLTWPRAGLTLSELNTLSDSNNLSGSNNLNLSDPLAVTSLNSSSSDSEVSSDVPNRPSHQQKLDHLRKWVYHDPPLWAPIPESWIEGDATAADSNPNDLNADLNARRAHHNVDAANNNNNNYYNNKWLRIEKTNRGRVLPEDLPLSTAGRYIIDKNKNRVNLRCINW